MPSQNNLRRREPASLPHKLSSFCLLFVLGLGCGLLQSVSACPSDCVCKWKNGKQTVECVNRSLRTFPGPIDANTQVLDVSGNSFETLPHDHFMRLGLINLQKIYLSKCRLSHINSKAFHGLRNLVELDLSHNVMREVPGPAFPGCQGLMKLFLNGNPIAIVQKNVFIALEALTHLEMSHCGIEVIEKGAFDGLVSLEWLKLNGNKLRRLSGLRSLPVALKGVWLEDNPWECDCRLLELRLWLGERNVANSVEPRCALPDRLTNCTLRELTVENFACTPQLSPTTMYQKIDEGKNVSLLCKVTSIPESSLEWLFNGKLLSNSSLNMVIETTSSFISASQQVQIGPTVAGGTQGYGGGQLSSPASTSTSSTMSMSLSVMSTGQGAFSGFAFGTMSERKSELLILNATAEENGTFTCMAMNPAGVAMANFTLRVLTAREEVEVSGIGLTSFVSHYPNLIIIVLSTGAVIGVVIVLCVIIVCICKCCRMCGKKGRRGDSGSEHGGSGRRSKSKRKSKGKGEAGKEGKEVTTMNSVVSSLGGCGGKLDRHLSETSTLTTHTKSNGSVFLLSTSSELGLGDSNPDLIEGVKRMEGDGHDHAFYKNGGVYAVSTGTEPQSSSSHHLQQQTLPKQSKKMNGGGGGGPSSSSSSLVLQQQQHTQTHYNLPSSSSQQHCGGGGAANPGTIVMEPPPFNAYPMDYGLPKSLNVSTLVRRSPSYPMASTTTIPPTYDLAKYPKEYINPQQPNQQMSSSPTYGYPPTPPPPPPPQLAYPHGHPHHHAHNHHPGGSPSNSNADYYPTTYILPHGAYVTTYNGPSGEEYTVTMDNYPGQHAHTHHNGPPGSCTCMPILEGNESDENKNEESSIPPPPPPISPSRKNTLPKHHGYCQGHPPPQTGSGPTQVSECVGTENSSLMISSSTSTTNLGGACSSGVVSVGVGNSSSGSKTPLGMGQPNVNARLHRQLTTQINESPDEGYEDESAEGTEI